MTRTFILSLFLCFVFQAVASADDKLTIFVDKTKFIDYVEMNLNSNKSYDPLIWRIINLYLWSNIFAVDYS